MANGSDANPTGKSFLQPYSIGIVAANKLLDSKDIEVTPVEDMPGLSGEVTDNVVTYTASGVDAQGSAFKTNIDTTASIKATWLPIGCTNRKTAPDVRRGEYVMIYRFGDTDKYWWVDMLQATTLRRLETVVFAISNNSQENIPDDANSTYFFEMSTITKTITLHTSKNDGEPFAYDLQINAKEGKIVVQDDASNYFMMDSANKQLIMSNGDDSCVNIDKTNIIITATDSVTINTKNYTLNSTNNQQNAQATVIDSSSTTVNGNSASVNAATNINSTLAVSGQASLNAGFSASGGSGGNAGIINGTLQVTTIESPNPVNAPDPD